MTLIITVVDKNRVVQVSDRRLTKLDSMVHDDKANKAVYVGMSGIFSRDKVVQYLEANREKLTEERAAEALVWLTRAARTHPVYGQTIGRDCLSVVVFPEAPRRTVLLSQTVEYPAPPTKPHFS